MSQSIKKDKRSHASRTLARPHYKSFRLSKKISHGKNPIPKARVLFVESVKHAISHKKLFGGLILIYGLLNLILIKGLSSSTDLIQLREEFGSLLTGISGQLVTGVALFGLLLGESSSTSSNEGQLYQTIILILVSLALIWALRQTHAGKKVGVRESFYKGMYPLVPFLIVLLVIGLQFIPLAIGGWLFNVTITSGLAVTGIEQFLWASFCFLLALLTVYMVSSSLFAIYVSTLPDMTPLKALRSTRELVRYRRWEIARKVLFLPLVLLLAGLIIMVPIIILAAPLAEWIFFALTLLAVVVSHSYFYSLYRELL